MSYCHIFDVLGGTQTGNEAPASLSNMKVTITLFCYCSNRYPQTRVWGRVKIYDGN